MTYSPFTATGNGSTTAYSIAFDYINSSDVKAKVNNVVTTAFSVSGSTVTFTTAPPSGQSIVIYRTTDNATIQADFQSGSALRSVDLNDNFTQLLYVTQESTDTSDEASTEAAAAVVTADSASNAAINAVNVATAASTAATNATNAANAATSASTLATGTANQALSNSTIAVNTANQADIDATAAVNASTTASNNATNAVTVATAADGNATTALNNSTSAVNTATTASGNATTALNTANQADANATTALNNSRESDGSGGYNSAIDKANSAVTTANTASGAATGAVSTANTASAAASNAVSIANAATATANAAASTVASAVFYTPVANFASFPSSPSNQDRIEVADSTGLQSQSIVAGIPSGFVGSSDLTMRLEYNSSTSKWDFKQYFAEDPEVRYMPKQGGTMTGLLTLSGAPTANLHAATKAYVDSANTSQDSTISTKLPLAGGTLTGALTLSGAPSSNLHAATKAYVDTEVAAVVDTAPGALDTLNELAASLGDDANFSTTVTNSIATKMPLAGGTFTGDVTFNSGQVFPTYFANQAAFPSATTYHGAVAHSHSDGAMYFAHGGSWNKLANNSSLSSYLPLAGGTLSGGLAGTTADFSGSVDAGGGLLVDGLTGTQNALRVVTGGTEKFAVKADGSTFFVGDVNLYANLDLQDNDKILLGTGDDFQFYHNGTNNYIDANGDLYIRVNNGTETALYATANGKTQLNYDNNQKLVTKSDGVDITGELQCDTLDVDGNSDITGTLTLNGQLNNSGTGGNRGGIFGNISVGYGAYYNSIQTNDGTSPLHLNYSSSGTVYVGTNGTVWHSNNDGSGSGLDADKLDGLQSASTPTASTVMTRDGNAYARAVYFMAGSSDTNTDGWFKARTDNNSTITPTGAVVMLNGWYYHQSRSNFQNWLNGAGVSISTTGTGSDIKSDAWLWNNRSGYGLYNAANNTHWVSTSTSEWTVRSNTTSTKIKFQTTGSQTRGYVYCDTASNFGFLDYAGNWLLKAPSGTRNVELPAGSFTASGNITAYSDITLKDNIETIPDALEKVSQIRGVTYNRNDLEDAPRQTGVIAQEVEKVLPEVVSENEDGLKTVAYGNIVGLLIESIKELKAEVDALKTQIEDQ